jgi:hypothetical protein
LGCLVATIIAVVVGGGLAWFLLHSIRGAVESYTTDSAIAIPVVQVDDATRQSADAKLSDLREVLKSKEGSGTFTFSGPELQAIAQNPDFGNRVFLDAKEDALYATFSFALADFENPVFDLLLSKELAQRFFNGSGIAKLGVVDGNLDVKFEELNLNGKSLEGEALAQAGWFVRGALESFILSLAGETASAGASDQPGPSRITNAGVRDGVLRLDIGPLTR